MKRSLEDRFWMKVEISDGCWDWTGYRGKNGYGRLSASYRERAPYRFSYELVVGPIPAGLQLDHLCRNRVCVNPAHLEAVTSRTNILRGNGVAARYATRTRCAQGHELLGANLALRTDGGRKCRACHAAYMRRWTRRVA